VSVLNVQEQEVVGQLRKSEAVLITTTTTLASANGFGLLKEAAQTAT
jgi:hypothetical protein